MYNAFLLRRLFAEQGFTFSTAANRLQQKLSPYKDRSPATSNLREWEEASLQMCYNLTNRAQAGEKFADSLLGASEGDQRVVTAEAQGHSRTWLVDSLLLETRVARLH